MCVCDWLETAPARGGIKHHMQLYMCEVLQVSISVSNKPHFDCFVPPTHTHMNTHSCTAHHLAHFMISMSAYALKYAP